MRANRDCLHSAPLASACAPTRRVHTSSSVFQTLKHSESSLRSEEGPPNSSSRTGGGPLHRVSVHPIVATKSRSCPCAFPGDFQQADAAVAAPAYAQQPAVGRSDRQYLAAQHPRLALQPAVEPPSRRKQVDNSQRHAVLLGVVQHVGQGISYFARRRQDPRVEPILEYTARAIPQPIESACHAYEQSLQSARKRATVVRFCDEVHMVLLHRIVNQPEPKALLARKECMLQDLAFANPAQACKARQNFRRHEHRQFPAQLCPRRARHESARAVGFATSSLSCSPTPAESEGVLNDPSCTHVLVSVSALHGAPNTVRCPTTSPEKTCEFDDSRMGRNSRAV